jgi:REP element-mobilizing transposase RayT
MPSTHTSLYYHLVWSTKDRRNPIDAAWKTRLHAWLGGCIKALDGAPLAIGGVADHVHCLAGLKLTHCLSDFMRVLKSESSEWIHDELRMPIFQWQEGYGAFTVSPSARKRVESYIRNQERHHRVKTFQEEYVELLEQAGIEYDEKYLW